ncbi:MAG: sulfatase-like hydrolase/transferase [Christensenellales bacterium]|jgi:arylsulfatase A-like enzyme
MKSLMMLVIDCFGDYGLEQLRFDPIPFIHSLQGRGLFYPNMYAQAPYTEAAVNALQCGVDTLQDGGYFYRMRDQKTLFEYFHEQGFRVLNYNLTRIYPSSILKGCTDFFYDVPYEFDTLWQFRLAYYAQRWRAGVLTRRDMEKCVRLMDDNFPEWIRFDQAFVSRAPQMSLIQEAIGADPAAVARDVTILQGQLARFRQDREGYILDLFERGQAHPLFGVQLLHLDQKLRNPAFERQVHDDFLPLLRQVDRKNRRMNRKWRKISWHTLASLTGDLLRDRDRESAQRFARYLKYFYDSIYDGDLYQRIEPGYDRFKTMPSLHAFCEHLKPWLLAHREEPFLVYLQMDDIHNREVFFSYDCDDPAILREELQTAWNTFSQLDPKLDTGSVTYYLSLSYIDLATRRLFTWMQEQGLLKRTGLALTADHGFSYDDRWIRHTRVNHTYLETYQIPFLLLGPGVAPDRRDQRVSSKDVLPTLLECFGIAPDPRVTGRSLLHPVNREVVFLEYAGGGCPDLDYRDAWVTAFDQRWFVSCRANYQHHFADLRIADLYHLERDPHQLRNLHRSAQARRAVEYLLEQVAARYRALDDNYTAYIKTQYAPDSDQLYRP